MSRPPANRDSPHQVTVGRFSGPLNHALRDARKQAGLSQLELAVKTGLSRVGIADIERGHSAPTMWTLQALATALNVVISIKP